MHGGARLIQQINRFVRQMPLRMGAHGNGHRGTQGVRCNAHLMMLFVFSRYAAQNSFRLLLIRFRDANFLKPTFQRRIFFNGLVIFLRCRRANQPNFSTRQCRLEQIGGINRPFRRPCTDQRMHLINKGNDIFGCAQLPHDVFEPFLKFSAIFRTGNQTRHI